MKLENYQILFDNEYNTYSPGDLIHGKIVFNLDEPIKIRSMFLIFKGVCKVHWMRQNEETQSDQIVNSQEEYFNDEKYIFGSEKELPEGKNEYAFPAFALPEQIPTSYEGKYGYVRYTTEVVFERSDEVDTKVLGIFTVINPFDLNAVDHLNDTARVVMEKSYCKFYFCRTGTLNSLVALKVTGYVPGQPMLIEAEIENGSNKEIAGIQFILKQYALYKAGKNNCYNIKDDQNVASVSLGSTAAGITKSCKAVIDIPALPASELKNCTLIDISYELFTEITVYGVEGTLKSWIPIVIGTIPLKNEIDTGKLRPITLRSTNVGQYFTDAVVITDWNKGGVPEISTLQYSATPDDKNDNHYYAFIDYKPLYPVYKFANN